MESTSNDLQVDFNHLEPDDIIIEKDTYHRLVLRVGDKRWEKVKPVRPFPLSAPESCVFLMDSDGHEIGLIRSVGDLKPAAREMLRSALALDYFVATVRAIRSVKSRHGVSSWVLDTDHGDRTAHIKDRSDIRKLSGNRVLMTDIEGMRFEIPDTSKLDERSQTLLDSET